VGHLLGSGDTGAAKAASKAVFFLIVGFMVSLSLIKIALRNQLGLAFTHDEEVVEKVASMVFIVCLFQVSDGVQAAVAGVMRGMGHQKIVAGMNFVGFWAIGVTLGAALTFGADVGVEGLWWGLAAGLTCTAMIGVVMVLQTDWDAETKAARQRIAGTEASSTKKSVEAASLPSSTEKCVEASDPKPEIVAI